MSFAQLVIGPPGSGKTTYCKGMQEFLTGVGREVSIINLDPANDVLPYSCDINVLDVVCLASAMEEFSLGPNGGLVYCMEYLEKNLDWLQESIEALFAGSKNGLESPSKKYLLIDCPGQVELYTHNKAMRNIVDYLTGELNIRCVAVHLVDSHYCSDPLKFVSVLLTSLTTMLHLELPHVNVLSKIDLIESYGALDFNLDYYTDVLDLSYLLERFSEAGHCEVQDAGHKHAQDAGHYEVQDA
eukprot:Sdes_comp18224_c0_seq1m7805